MTDSTTTPVQDLQAFHAAYATSSAPENKIVAFFQRVISVATHLHDRLTKVENFVNPIMEEGAAMTGNAKIEALEQRIITLETTINKIAEGVQVGTQAFEGVTPPVTKV